MAQRVQKMVMTPTPGQPGKGDITWYIEGTDGDPSGVKLQENVTFEDALTGDAPGDFLVGDFPDIDLPTT